MAQALNSKQRRQYRVRNRVRSTSLKSGRPRLSVFRSGKQIYAQIIDDVQGVTLASASSLEGKAKAGSSVEAAGKVGQSLAERAKKAGVTQVVFDRGSYLYHGRVKALAEAAREGGLDF